MYHNDGRVCAEPVRVVFVMTGCFLPKPVACSNACAICRTLKSSLLRPTICTPTGSRSGVEPPVTEAARLPVAEMYQQDFIQSIGKAMDLWAHQAGVKLNFICPGKPVENSYIESFNGWLRDECLNVEVFLDLADARRKLDNTDYDNVYFNGYSGSMPFIMRGGGFYHRFRRGGFSTGGTYGTPESILVAIPNALGITPAGGVQLSGVVKFEESEFWSKGILYEPGDSPT
jgi:integrase-like protein